MAAKNSDEFVFCLLRPHRTALYEDPPAACWPIVYSPDYNITFVGLEKLHPFDAGKWGKVINFLKGKITESTS